MRWSYYSEVTEENIQLTNNVTCEHGDTVNLVLFINNESYS
jgi:hypothetical protein